MHRRSPFEMARTADAAVITFNDPSSLNGFREGVLERLAGLVEEVQADPATRYIVLQGGSDFFASGGAADYLIDLSVQDRAARLAVLKASQANIRTLLRSPCMTVAAVDGLAAGAGVDLALCFDVMLVGPKARINFVYTKLGVIPDLGGLALLADRLGRQRALGLYATSPTWNADSAERLGIGEAVADLPRDAKAWAQLLARRFPITRAAYAAAKQSLLQLSFGDFTAHQDAIAEDQADLFGTSAFRERISRVSAMQKLLAKPAEAPIHHTET